MAKQGPPAAISAQQSLVSMMQKGLLLQTHLSCCYYCRANPEVLLQACKPSHPPFRAVLQVGF